MRRSPLVALLVSFSFALQILAARDGTTCVITGAEDHGPGMSAEGQGMAAMRGMDMPADASGKSAAPASSCDHTSATTACLVMAPCASGFLAISATVHDEAAPLPDRVMVTTAGMPPSRDNPPEPPPPRA